jgi:Uma2 family endonuclease
MAETTRVRWTIADLEPLPDFDGTRYEIIDGELYVSKPNHWNHQVACCNLCVSLAIWSLETSQGDAVQAPGIIFSDENAVAPDVVWISKSRQAAVLGEDGKLHGAPELVIEVLSPGAVNERRDKEAKLKLYSVHGVREYWIVDWVPQTVEIYRRVSATLQLATTLHREDKLTSPLLPKFKLRVSEIFA